MANERLSTEQWGRYWRRDNVTTFWRNNNQNYDREFADFWNVRFATLRKQARLLDLGTGNGALAILAADYSARHAKDFAITGIDSASIEPRARLAAHQSLQGLLAQIRFVGRTPMEATGLPPASFDFAMSQYGIEYGEAAATARELSRVVMPGGSLAAVLHHSDSVVVALARDHLAQITYCLQEERLDERAAALVSAIGEARTPEARATLKGNAEAETARAELNAAVARIQSTASRFRDPEGLIGVLVPSLMNVFVAHKERSLIERQWYIEKVRDEFIGFKARMADLQSAALSEEDLARLSQALADNGLMVRDRGLLRYGPNLDLMGWTLVAEKRG